MKMNKLIPGMLFLVLAGCGGTTVVLVPDDDGKVGAVDMQTKAGSHTLNRANESASVADTNERPEKTEILDQADIHARFGEVLAIQPATPEHWNIQNFASGSSDISIYAHKLDDIVAAINKRKSCDVVVIGHCDTVGTNADNEGISKARALSVKQYLLKKGIAGNCVGEVRFYGENVPFKPTADNVDEPLNRRVEVEIR